jgi:hypothetical protein
VKKDVYREKLRTLDNWDSYLLEESGLPGPRGNIELAQAVADEGNLTLFQLHGRYRPNQLALRIPGLLWRRWPGQFVRRGQY